MLQKTIHRNMYWMSWTPCEFYILLYLVHCSCAVFMLQLYCICTVVVLQLCCSCTLVVLQFVLYLSCRCVAFELQQIVTECSQTRSVTIPVLLALDCYWLPGYVIFCVYQVSSYIEEWNDEKSLSTWMLTGILTVIRN